MGWGGGIALKTKNSGRLRIYFIVQILLLSLTGLAVPCVPESEDQAMAEMTISLQADLVLSDAAATNEP